MRDVALSAGIGGNVAGVSGAEFFKAQTNKINLLKEVENLIADELYMQLQDRKKSTRNAAITAIVVAIFAVIASIGAAIATSLLVRKNMTAVSDAATAMAAGNLEVAVPEVTKSELGAISGALDKFRHSILEAKTQEEAQREKELLEAERHREQERSAQEAKQERIEKEQKAADLQRAREQEIAAEIALVVSACAKGDFTRRLDTAGKEGVFGELCNGINQISEATDSGLSEIVKSMGALASGDLTYRIEGRFQGVFEKIAVTVNDTMSSLTEVLGGIKDSSHIVHTSTEELSSAANDLSRRTERNAATLEETSAALAQLQQAVQNASEIADSSQETSLDVLKQANDGLEVVESAIRAMQAIKESSTSIGEIVDLIDSIAFQTNLLALNAGSKRRAQVRPGKGCRCGNRS